MDSMVNKIWITWENQRRSIELSKAFKAKLHIILPYKNIFGKRPFKYIILSFKTVGVLIKDRPQIVFGQNPSILLALLLCLLRRYFGYKLIIDRHSNFKLHKNPKLWKWKVFHLISRKTVKMADLTIVTNAFLSQLVNSWGGRSFILEDKIPTSINLQMGPKECKSSVVFITSYNDDEPVQEMLSAVAYLPEEWHFYFTGDNKQFLEKCRKMKLSGNITFTGYLAENEYQNLLNSATLLVVLTKQEHTLTCGAYEAISLGKPAVLSDTDAIKNYFKLGVVYVKPDSISIANGIFKAWKKRSKLQNESIMFKYELEKEWNKKFFKLKNILKCL